MLRHLNQTEDCADDRQNSAAIDIRMIIEKQQRSIYFIFRPTVIRIAHIIIYYSRAARVQNIIICVTVRFVNDGCNDRCHGKRVYKWLLKKRIGIHK